MINLYSIYLSIYRVTIRFTTDNIDAINNRKQYHDFTIEDNITKYHFEFIYLDRLEKCCRFNGTDTFVVEAPYDEIRKSELLKTLVFMCAQWVLQSHHIYMLHASCVIYNDNNALLLWGSSGSGKTSLATELCKNKNWSFYSNGSTLVEFQDGKFSVIGSMKRNIKLRYSSLIQQNPDMAHQFFPNLATEENGFDKKIVVSPEKLGLRVLTSTFQVSNIYVIKLIKENVREITYKPSDISMIFYNDLSRFIRLSDVYSLYSDDSSQTIYIPFMDNQKLHNGRKEFINVLIRQNCVHGLYGDLSSCVSYLNNKFNIFR